jgi:iron complex outermembrane recepter protein
MAAELSEQDYFSELPTVLTVSRLAQPISETPGAITVINRETIRRSGARELADVLRLVPGYLIGGFNGANPVAAYHVPLDNYGIRNLVLVDGRPVYSGYYIGDTHRGMMGVLLEDIERIEVLRGSNSAAYGANAMFGVINIITRHTLDTRGGEVSVTGGEGGVWDNMARIGWGNEMASFRLSAGRRSDSGYRNAHDDKIVSQLHLRGDLRPTADQELMLAAGVSEIAGGDGFPNTAGNPLRTVDYRDVYFHGQWRKQLSATDEIKLTANFDDEKLQDAFVYTLDPSVTISTSGRGRRINLELQHQVGITSNLRAVWGAGYKYEEAKSPPLYAMPDAVSFHEERLFGNLEWRPHPQWLINAGGFFGHHSWVGNYFSPRLMANFHVAPDHTLRAGISESARMPTLFELAADSRVYPQTIPPYNILRTFGLIVPKILYLASGNVAQEKLQTREVGYFGNFRDWRLTADVRGYIEKLKDQIGDIDRNVFMFTHPIFLTPVYDLVPDYTNQAGFTVRGIEYQVRWKPLEGTEIWLNQNFQNLIWDATALNKTLNLPPQRATTLALFQKLPYDFDLSVMYHTMGAMSWGNARDALPSRNQLDARLAKTFRIGSTRVEAAFAVQAAKGTYPEYLARKDFAFERRAFGSLRLEF